MSRSILTRSLDDATHLAVPQGGTQGSPRTAPRHRVGAARASQARPDRLRGPSPDPKTARGKLSADEKELMLAMDEYKLASGRMFPTWSEVLEVLQNLGYAKPTPAPAPELPCFGDRPGVQAPHRIARSARESSGGPVQLDQPQGPSNN